MSLRLCFTLLLAGLGAVAARGQVTFTFVGTAQYSALGYCVDEAVTFTFTTGSSFASTESSYFGEGNNWAEDFQTDPQLFTALTGTKLTGSLTRPEGDDTYVSLGTSYNRKELSIYLFNQGTYGIGLGLPLDALLNEVDVYIDVNNNPLSIDGGPFPMLSSYGDPVAYFSALSSTYGDLCSSTLTLWDTNDNSVDFTITSMTISAIPEPSTYAAFFGVAALGIVALRRWQKKV